MKSLLLLANLLLHLVIAAPRPADKLWSRVLRDYARGNVTVYRHADPNWQPGPKNTVRIESIVTEHMPTLRFVSRSRPLACKGLMYTSHDASREVDRALDMVKAEWAIKQGVCFFRINIDIPTSISGASAPPEVAQAWRRRTPNDPIVLVDRYKGGLLLMAMVKSGLITTSGNESDTTLPWIFYVDGDVGMANMDRSLDELVRNAVRASHRRTLEERTLDEQLARVARNTSMSTNEIGERARAVIRNFKFVGNTPDTPEHRNLHMLFPHGDCLLQRSFVQSGTILFKPSRLSGYVFEIVASSPYHVIDTGYFAMGDQAILDWLLTNSFGVRWSGHTTYHCPNSNFNKACHERSQLTYVARVNNPSNNAQHNSYQHAFLSLQNAQDVAAQSLAMWEQEPSQLPLTELSEFDYNDSDDELDMMYEGFGRQAVDLRKSVSYSNTQTSALVSSQHLRQAASASSLWMAPSFGDDRFVQQMFMSESDKQLNAYQLDKLPIAYGAGKQLLERYWRIWQPPQDGYIAASCSRWTNSPICNARRRRGESSPFHFRCGDLLFHLYGCDKSELYSPSMHHILSDNPVCQNVLPQSLTRIIDRQYSH